MQFLIEKLILEEIATEAAFEVLVNQATVWFYCDLTKFSVLQTSENILSSFIWCNFFNSLFDHSKDRLRSFKWYAENSSKTTRRMQLVKNNLIGINARKTVRKLHITSFLIFRSSILANFIEQFQPWKMISITCKGSSWLPLWTDW